MTATVLLVAINFPPVRGGSAVVYDCLARGAAGRISVLAPRVSYLDGLPLIGWREHDRHVPYPVRRLRLLRTVLRDGRLPGVLRRTAARLGDLRMRAHVAWTVLRLVRRDGHGAVCVGELIAGSWLVGVLRRVPGLRVLAYVHGEEITTADPYDGGRRRCRRALHLAHGIVVVSRFTQTAVLSLLGPEAAGKIRLIENGVDTARFSPGPRRPDLVARFGLQGCFVFVTVCRLLEKKGVDHALRAFAGLSDPDCRFLVVGAGPYEAALRALAIDLGIAETVVFAGLVAAEDLADCYRLGDVFVMPNRELPNGDTEGFGLVFLEANGCGVPVIAGRDGGSTDAVRDEVNGLVVDGHSVAAIGAAMLRLRHDAALRARLREAGLLLAAEAGWAAKAQDFLAFASGAGSGAV